LTLLTDWSSNTHASLVVLVNHEKFFCAVRVAPTLLVRERVELWKMLPSSTAPAEFMNPVGLNDLYISPDCS